MTLTSRSPWLLGRYSRQLRKRCAGANMVYSRAERVFILEHYSTSKSVVREEFSKHQFQQRDAAAGIQYCHWFRRFVRDWIHV
jgi:hypothetical protein